MSTQENDSEPGAFKQLLFTAIWSHARRSLTSFSQSVDTMWTRTQQDESWDVPGGPYYTDVTSLVGFAADREY